MTIMATPPRIEAAMGDSNRCDGDRCTIWDSGGDGRAGRSRDGGEGRGNGRLGNYGYGYGGDDDGCGARRNATAGAARQRWWR